MLSEWKTYAWNSLGIVVGLLVALIYGKFMRDLHENALFFSGIKQIERLISLRTESGFYYSFYQHVVSGKGIFSLLNDTTSEYPHSINALKQFNIYPEVLIALLYRILPFKLSSIFFYANTCFFFTALNAFATYLLSWAYNGEWIYGLMTGAWLIVNYEDFGRTNFVLNLRECFALPFYWLSLVFIIKALRGSYSPIPIATFTFLFSTCWQFSQFILLLQSCALLVVCLLKPEFESKIRQILFSQSIGFLFTMVVHFFHPMLATAPVLCLNFAITVTTSRLYTRHFFTIKSCLIAFLLIVIVFAFSWLVVILKIKQDESLNSDSHIFTFFLAKFGIVLSEKGIPFETSIYLCHPGFTFMDYYFVERTQRNGVLQMYGLMVLIFIFYSVYTHYKQNRRPPADQLFVIVQSLFFALMAYTTMRMKYVFVPEMAVIASASFGLMDRFLGRYFKYIMICAVVTKLSTDHYAFYQKVMSREQQFYDPDTVELMEFINREPKTNVYSGSMQLMAGVKCCTGRRVTNHPHFEDKRIRDRTLRIYSMYARMSIEEVNQILKSENSTHIIVENSICYTKSTGCALKDVIDTAYEYKTESGLKPFESKRTYPVNDLDRFCNAVEQKAQNLFVRIFRNRTFRVYRVV